MSLHFKSGKGDRKSLEIAIDISVNSGDLGKNKTKSS